MPIGVTSAISLSIPAVAGTASTTITSASLSGPPAGSLVVVFASDTGGAGDGSYSFAGPSPSTGWTTILQLADNEAVGDQTYVGAYYVTGSFPNTFFTGALGLNITAVVLTGAAGPVVIDGDIGTTHAFVAPAFATTSTITTAINNSMLLAFFSANLVSGRSWSATPPTGTFLAARSTSATSVAPAAALYYLDRGTNTGVVNSLTANLSVTGGSTTTILLAIKEFTSGGGGPAIIIVPKIGWGILL